MRVDTSPLVASLRDLRPLEIRQVRRSADEGLFNGLLAQYHYLGYQQPVGAHLKYLVWGAGRPLACVGGVGPAHLGRAIDSSGGRPRPGAESPRVPTTRDS